MTTNSFLILMCSIMKRSLRKFKESSNRRQRNLVELVQAASEFKYRHFMSSRDVITNLLRMNDERQIRNAIQLMELKIGKLSCVIFNLPNRLYKLIIAILFVSRQPQRKRNWRNLSNAFVYSSTLTWFSFNLLLAFELRKRVSQRNFTCALQLSFPLAQNYPRAISWSHHFHQNKKCTQAILKQHVSLASHVWSYIAIFRMKLSNVT